MFFTIYNYIYDKISGTQIPLKDLVISANHNPNRCHALIQNTINTLSNEVKEKNLSPIFMTLTLPSVYHKMKFDNKANDIQINIENATSYIMKYINKTLPLSKKENLSTKDKYLNAWYCKHRIIRFNCSRTLAPLSLYRLLHDKFNLKELTLLVKKKSLAIFVLQTNRDKIMEIFNGDELIYQRSENYSLRNGLLDF